jgi:hypothetical protein
MLPINREIPMFSPCGRLFLLILLTIFFTTDSEAQGYRVRDLGNQSLFQDTLFGHHKRGRATIAADFNLDGSLDFYMGNPGDESFVMRAVPRANGKVKYVLQQVLLVGDLAWAGVSFDYDNDGDYDIFVSCGGNEGIGFDYLFRNEWIPSGVLSFTDVTDEAGVAGIVPQGETEPIMTASAGATIADYDLDGDGDIFVSGNVKELQGHPELEGRNTLWRNNGDGTFTDVTDASGLGVSLNLTRHSTWFDYDNDGDPDLFENNYLGYNILWRNNGEGTFTDVTIEMSAPGHDLRYPYPSFASTSSDFNNDGWEDLIVFMRGTGDGPLGPEDNDCGCSDCPISLEGKDPTLSLSPYPDGHALFMNRGGVEFENIAATTHLNDAYVSDPLLGVMGCQVGDVTGDGIADVYIGNGGPTSGYADQFYVSASEGGADPVFTDLTSLIDFPAVIPPGIPVPPYPYRTHGVAIVDVDNDGTLEIAVNNGGPAGQDDEVREPNRLFKITPTVPTSWLKVRPVGDGVTISKDAIGTRISLLVGNAAGDRWMVHKTLFGGSAFSAQNGYVVHFGLGDATIVEEMELKWPGGTVTTIDEGLAINTSMMVEFNAGSVLVSVDDALALSDATVPWGTTLRQNYPNPFNPATTINYSLEQDVKVSLRIYDVLGRHVRTLVDDVQPVGEKAVVWDGTDDVGRHVSSGVYMYVLNSGDEVQSQKMLLTR